MISEDIQFWHDNFAMRIQSSLTDPELTPGLMYLHDSNAGEKQLRLGSQTHFYYCDAERAVSYGYLVGSESEQHTHHSRRDPSVVALRDLVFFLIREGKPPFMVGELNKRNPANDFKVSYSRQQVHYCRADARISFNLDKLERLIHLCEGIPTAAVMQAFDLYSHYATNRNAMTASQTKRFQKVLATYPQLAEAIRIEGLTHGCGELEALRWTRHTPKTEDESNGSSEEQS